jgi:hypothetical protein
MALPSFYLRESFIIAEIHNNCSKKGNNVNFTFTLCSKCKKLFLKKILQEEL